MQMGVYLENIEKSHIPDGAGYLEKYYFNPGDTGFQVWETKFGKIGIVFVGINGFLKQQELWR